MKKITVRLPEELHDRLVEISRRDTRSINSTVLVAIERYCGPRPSYEDQVKNDLGMLEDLFPGL